MGRPKAVNIKTFPLYNKLHTKKTKMYCGVEMTTLYPIKETDQYYISPEVWAYCASKFRHKKKGFKLNVDIPVIQDKKTIDFLAKHCWNDWVDRQLKDGDSDMKEAVHLLTKIFPGKNLKCFYELNSIISSYTHGTFLSYDDDGNIEPPSEHAIKNRKYYTHKYVKYCDDPTVKTLMTKWTDEKNKKLADKYLTEYMNAEEEYAYKNHSLDDVFVDIGKHSVCYPVAFTENTAEWSREKYGKLLGYAHAGEIYFVVTPDTVYFDVSRHF